MSVLVPLAPNPDAALARFNPVAKIAAAGIVMVGLLLTLDPVTPALLLVTHDEALVDALADRTVTMSGAPR